MRIARNVLRASILVVWSGSALAGSLNLPTPREFYLNYSSEQEAARLVGEISTQLSPQQKIQAMQIFSAFQSGQISEINEADVRELLKGIDWTEHRADLLRLLVHQSGVLGIVSDSAAGWRPFIHDFLLFFLHQLSDERLIERMISQVKLWQDSDPGQRTLALIERTPTLQKIGQILARYPTVPEDMRRALQSLENSIRTTDRDELVQFVKEEIGEAKILRYGLQLDEEVLAEATVGAVIAGSLVLPGESHPRRTVCKIVKPYASAAVREELEILDDLVSYFEEHGDFYDLGDIPLADTFAEVKKALSREILIVEEQKNLSAAWAYYQGNDQVLVPELFPISTDSVTCMEFVQGPKIVDAYPGDQESRSKLARRLDRLMTLDVILSRQEETIFHGDPHAGNVFHVDDPDDGFRIGLLDWGLRGVLTRAQREQLIQLMLGIYLGNEKRVRNHAAVLLENGLPSDPAEAKRVQTIAVETARNTFAKGLFDVLSEVILALTTAGYELDFHVVLFIKSQLTIRGIIHELDPELNRRDSSIGGASGMVLKELPKRLLYTIYFPKWTSHDYDSMVSNEDIRDVANRKIASGFRKLGGWIWSGINFPFRRPDPTGAPRAVGGG